MVMLILMFLVSQLPGVVMFIWLRNQKVMEEDYQKLCTNALIRGLFCVVPVFLFSAFLSLFGYMIHMKSYGTIPYELYYCFIVLAFSEECVKFGMFLLMTRKHSYSWLTATIYMMIVSLGFEIIESIVYTASSNPGQMIVRGVTMMHVAFGLIEGYFYGKSVYTGKKGYIIFGWILAWLSHGLYDFSLHVADDANIFFSIAPLALAAACPILILFAIRFILKAESDEQYVKILREALVKEEVPE